MKIRKIGYSPIFILLIVTGMFQSCTDKSELLVKTWKLDSLKYTRQIPPTMQASIDNVVNELKKTFTLTYYANGTYTSHTKEMVVNGKWKLNPGSTKIISTTDKGEKTEYEIMKLTENEFEFKAQEGKEEVIFVMVPASPVASGQ